MKSILLASASLFALAGAASADIAWSGSATVGYNDTINEAKSDDTAGFYWSFGLDVTAETTLDNGLVIGATIGGDLVDGDTGGNISWSPDGWELYITADNAGLYFGDTDLAADAYFSTPDGMDVGFDGDAVGDAVIRGEFTFSTVSAYLSYSVNEDTTANALVGLQLVLAGTFGNFDVAVAYQDADNDSGNEVFGISAGTTFGAADISVAYTADQTNDASSLGVGVSYPVGPVTVGVYYASNEPAADAYGVSVDYANGPISVSVAYDTDADDNSDWGIEGSYDLGNGIVVKAGVLDSGEDTYVAAEWAIDSNLSLLFSYADDADGDNADDEIGDPEYQEGLTVEASLSF